MVLKLFTEIEVKLSITPTVRAKRGNGERSESNRPPNVTRDETLTSWAEA